ncbi:BQ5605_C016g08257 [Microbotryum silenes-dioicae]|uniref:BQ5605_C016g08257 protein n=1 Tax=Microbotryum silenes-dioicae TaxID=796604 RepID=A0A2X0MHF8_9BASI|nr:BQ5605_C016g08257 [Microbotryum silenes-dioicae]
MVEGTTLRRGKHAKQVVWEAESHMSGRFDGKWNLDERWNLGEGRRSGLADAETALANWDALDRELPMTSRHVVCLVLECSLSRRRFLFFKF